MSPGGGGGQPSCTTVPLGKLVRRTLRAAVGMKKEKKKKPSREPAAESIGGVSMRRLSSFSAESLGPATKESVVRVVLKSGVVEVYPGVVLACTVIRKHPPGLCLAHPDVFRNPHGAVVRPLEPLFPGQKFLLLPETTVIRLKQKIPESSIGAFADEDEEEGDDEYEYEVASTTDASEESDQDYSSGTAASSSSPEEEEQDAAAGDGGVVAECMAREFYEANDRWSQCHFNKLVRRGLAVEQSKEPERKDKAKKQGKKKRKGKKTRKERRVPAPPGLRMFATPRRTWEPSLPAVEEEAADVSPLCTTSDAITEDHEQDFFVVAA